nr:MAG TPA: replisome organizer [Caudoviricetes sp.]
MSKLDFIRMDTNIFNNHKIRVIRKAPGGATLIVIWFKLLALAGREFPDGEFITNGKGITDEMLATILDEHELTVSDALRTFTELGMLDWRDGVYTIRNWKKWQSPEAPF